MSVCFKIVTIFVAYVGNGWDGANSWKHLMWTYPLFCLFLALLAYFRVIVDWRRCEKRFVAVESLYVTLEEVLRWIAIHTFLFALRSMTCL